MRFSENVDLTTSDLTGAWQQGDKKLFYPYDRTYEHTDTAVSLRNVLNQQDEGE